MKILSIVGARPQLIKEAQLSEIVREQHAWKHVLVNFCPHSNILMNEVFFQQLGIPAPQYAPDVACENPVEQTARVLQALDPILKAERPHGVLVYGYSDSTLAGALAAAKHNIPVIHIDATSRLDVDSMTGAGFSPEELNSAITNRLSSVLCCCSQSDADNLRKENHTGLIRVTGDVGYDLFLRMWPKLDPDAACQYFGLRPGRFIVATLHRNFNVDNQNNLRNILTGLVNVRRATSLPLLLLLHPRTRKNILAFKLEHLAAALTLLEPQGYQEIISLILASAGVITDSNGLQKEACYAAKRAVAIMPATPCRELIQCGWNLLAEPTAESVEQMGLSILHPHPHPGPLYGNGQASQAIVRLVKKTLHEHTVQAR